MSRWPVAPFWGKPALLNSRVSLSPGRRASQSRTGLGKSWSKCTRRALFQQGPSAPDSPTENLEETLQRSEWRYQVVAGAAVRQEGLWAVPSFEESPSSPVSARLAAGFLASGSKIQEAEWLQTHVSASQAWRPESEVRELPALPILGSLPGTQGARSSTLCPPGPVTGCRRGVFELFPPADLTCTA